MNIYDQYKFLVARVHKNGSIGPVIAIFSSDTHAIDYADYLGPDFGVVTTDTTVMYADTGLKHYVHLTPPSQKQPKEPRPFKS